MNIDITIPEKEIIEVLTEHVKSKMPALNVTGIDLKATRKGEAGVIAEVNADFGQPKEVKGTDTGKVDTPVTTESSEPIAEEAPPVEEETSATKEPEPEEADDNKPAKRPLFSKPE